MNGQMEWPTGNVKDNVLDSNHIYVVILMLYIVELGYNVTKGTIYFMSL